MDANSRLAISNQMSLLIGWGIGGWLVETAGSIPILVGTAGLFLISTLSLLFVVDPLQEKLSLSKETAGWESLREGWNLLRSHPLLSRVTTMDVLDNVSNSVWAGAIMLAFVTEFLHEDKTWWGYLNGVYFAGSFLGGILALKWSNHMNRRLHASLVWGETSLSLLIFLFVLIPIAPVSSLILFVRSRK